MEMSQIRYFIAVSETLNFTRAAERCFVSQPALTKGIKKLECSIGGELLHRTKNSVTLSFLGESLLPKFKKIYQDAKQARDEAHRLMTQSGSLVKVGIQNNIYLGEILPFIQTYKNLNSEIEFEFFENNYQILKDKLSSHQVDVAFLSKPVRDSEPHFDHVVCSETFVIAFGERHNFRGKKIICYNDLQGENFCFREHCDSSSLLNEFLSNHDIYMNVVCSSSKDDWVKSLVQASFGITYLPKSQAIKEDLFYVEVTDYLMSRSIFLETVNDEFESEEINAFVQSLYTQYSATSTRLDLQVDLAG